MAEIPANPEEVRIHRRQPLYERLQEWIRRADETLGVRWFNVGLFCLLALLVILLYTGTQFYGLRDREAMDMGQLGRNLWRTGGAYVTRVIRPLELWHLNRVNRPPMYKDLGVQPELWTPPMYPWLLSWLFRFSHPSFELSQVARIVPADRWVMLLSWIFFVIGLLLTYLLARDLFDQRVAVLSIWLYLLADPLLDFAISGLAFNFLSVLFLVATYGVYKADQWELEGKPGWRVDVALAISVFAVGIGTLTHYAFAAVLVPVVVYVVLSLQRRRLVRLAMCLAIFFVILAPWMIRNWKVSRTWFGLTRYAMIEKTGENMPREVRADELQRTYGLDLKEVHPWQVMRRGLLTMRQMYEVSIKDVGSSYLIAFFIVALFHRYKRDEVFRMRRFAFWSLMMAAIWLSLTEPPQRNFLNIFLPVVIIYSVAFFYVMFERLQFRKKLVRRAMVGLFVLLNVLPFIYTILPPTAPQPYPPYDAGILTWFGKSFRQDETICTDIPWAVAWYGDRTAIWQPYGEKDYFAVNDNVGFISGIYLTQATFQEMTPIELLSGQMRFWTRLYQPPPESFPLTAFEPITPDGKQVLISNRRRVRPTTPTTPEEGGSLDSGGSGS